MGITTGFKLFLNEIDIFLKYGYGNVSNFYEKTNHRSISFTTCSDISFEVSSDEFEFLLDFKKNLGTYKWIDSDMTDTWVLHKVLRPLLYDSVMACRVSGIDNSRYVIKSSDKEYMILKLERGEYIDKVYVYLKDKCFRYKLGDSKCIKDCLDTIVEEWWQ